METVLAVIVGLTVGVAVGWWSRRPSGRAATGPVMSAPRIDDPAPPLPTEVTDLLAMLSASGIVLNAGQTVVACSPTAISLGLVRGAVVMHAPLLDLAQRAVAEDRVVEEELGLPRGPRVEARRVVKARAARLGEAHVVLIVEDRSHAFLVEEVRRDFLANVSHELKTPVGGLLLLAEAVKGAKNDPEAVARFAKRMRKESKRLDQLVTDIVQLSRLQSEDRLAEPAPVDLADVVEQAIDDVRVTAEGRDTELVARCDPDCWVWGDAGLLVTAARNLVVNAVTYSPRHTRVAVRALKAPDGARELIVTDQGPGIPESEQGRIFERFYRIDAARSRATGGTGLGLSIVKHVCASHGGDVTVWSELGSGSTFTMRLPAPAYGPDTGDDAADRATKPTSPTRIEPAEAADLEAHTT